MVRAKNVATFSHNQTNRTKQYISPTPNRSYKRKEVHKKILEKNISSL